MNLTSASTDDLITELEERERNGRGMWTGHQESRINVLARKLNTLPLDAPREVVEACRLLDRYGY
jgi:hypothetical protein